MLSPCGVSVVVVFHCWDLIRAANPLCCLYEIY
jgi:hypothetical protein